jgi:hypothetical protein
VDGQEQEALLVQVPEQADEPGLIGVDDQLGG